MRAGMAQLEEMPARAGRGGDSKRQGVGYCRESVVKIRLVEINVTSQPFVDYSDVVCEGEFCRH